MEKADNPGVAEGEDGYFNGTTGLPVGIHIATSVYLTACKHIIWQFDRNGQIVLEKWQPNFSTIVDVIQILKSLTASYGRCDHYTQDTSL